MTVPSASAWHPQPAFPLMCNIPLPGYSWVWRYLQSDLKKQHMLLFAQMLVLAERGGCLWASAGIPSHHSVLFSIASVPGMASGTHYYGGDGSGSVTTRVALAPLAIRAKQSHVGVPLQCPAVPTGSAVVPRDPAAPVPTGERGGGGQALRLCHTHSSEIRLV